MKKILLAISLSVCMSAHATDFLGINLEKSTPNQLHAVIKKAGGNLVENHSTSFIQLYKMSNSEIPNAINAAVYWNEKQEFVGLRIGFAGSTHEQNALKKNLASKFGDGKNLSLESLHNNKLSKDYNSRDNTTWIENDLVINMNNGSFKTMLTPGIIPSFDSFSEKYRLRFIHTKRLEGLKTYLNTQVNTTDSNKWKGKL